MPTLLFAVLAVLGLNLFTATAPVGAAQDGTGGTDAANSEARPPLRVSPPSLLQESDRETTAKIAEELRRFEAPTAVVVRLIAEPSDETQAAAAELYEEDPVESRPDAADGLLVLVEIPRDNHVATTIGFANGANFYPRGGITPDRLTEIVQTEVQPLIDRGNIGDAIVNMMQWIAWTQLFESSPRLELTETQGTLQKALDRGAAPLLVLVAAALVGFAWWTHHRTRRGMPVASPGEAATALDAIQAGTLARGRVDGAVLTGALLQLHDRGAIAFAPPVNGRPALHLVDASQCRGTSDRLVWAELISVANPSTGVVPTDRLRWLGQLWGSAAGGMERELMNAGLMHPQARRDDATLSLAWILGAAMAVLLLIPTLIAQARFAVGAEALLLLTALVIWWWSRRRSWTTAAGAATQHNWLRRHTAIDQERLIFDVIVRQDRTPDNDFIIARDPSAGQPVTPVNALITTVRGFGRA